MIPTEVLNRFYMQTLDWYKKQHGDTLDTEVTFYKAFLIVTDYVPSKMMEAQLAGEAINEDYSAVLQYRKEAREKINALRGCGNDGQEA